MIIAQQDDLNKQFEKIYEAEDKETMRVLLKKLCDMFIQGVSSFLDSHGSILSLGKYGSGKVAFAGTREKTIEIRGESFIMTLPRLRCRKLHFCQLLLPSFAVPRLRKPVKEIVEICLEADSPEVLLDETRQNNVVFPIVEKFRQIREFLRKNDIFLFHGMNLCTLCADYIRLTHHQFFSLYFKPETSSGKPTRSFTDILVEL